MQAKSYSKRGGFTLVEIMIVVAIIALLAAIAVPSFLRARKRSQATATLETLRMIDAAKDQYAIECGKGPGVTPDPADLVKYIKTGTKLYTDMDTGAGMLDALNYPITMNGVDVAPWVNTLTRTALDDALGGTTTADNFWGAYHQ
jgi:prepilin-type N-terminal cleavage/methylation domain-containing protein